jgi:putative oxidoreductase
MHIGLLILRVVVGGLVAGHGAQKLFGWFRGHGIAGTGGFFESLGFRPGRWMAVLGGMAELGGGSLLMLGFLTPFGSAAIIGVMTTAALSVHLEKGLWNTEGGFELPLAYATAAATVAFTGPGRYSMDAALGLPLRGIAWGALSIVVGVSAAMIMNSFRVASLQRAAATDATTVIEPKERRRAA